MKDKNRFYSLWSLAILLCTALCIFLLFYASLAKPKDKSKDNNQSETPSYTQEQSEY